MQAYLMETPESYGDILISFNLVRCGKMHDGN